MQLSLICCFRLLFRIYGPNSEIEWNKEGSRGFLIINRKSAQTALTPVADKANELGKTLNKNLKSPSDTSRDRVLHVENDANASEIIIDADPSNVNMLCIFGFCLKTHTIF